MERKTFFLAILSLWVGVVSTFFTPIMPNIADYFSITLNQIQSMGVLYYLGFAIANACIIYSNQLWGVDQTVKIAISTACMGLFTMICSSHYLGFFVGWFLVCIGASSFFVLPNMILKATISNTRILYQAYGTIIAAYTIGACIGPVIVGIVCQLYHWKTVVILQGLFGALLLIIIYQRGYKSQAKRTQTAIESISQIQRHPMFVSLVLSVSNTSSYLVSINFLMPMMLFHFYQSQPAFTGLCIFIANLAIILGSKITVISSLHQIQINQISAIISWLALVTLVLSYLLMGYVTMFSIVLCFCLLGLCRGLSLPSILSLATDLIDADADVLMPLMMAYSVIPTLLIIQMIVHLPEHSVWAVAGFLTILSLMHFITSDRISKQVLKTETVQ